MTGIRSYRDLRVWQQAMDLAETAYRITKSFPREEIFGLTAQIRRSASSVAANIAEGDGRENTGSYIQFLRIAQGSLKELETHVSLSQRIGYCQLSIHDDVLETSEAIGKMLRSLMRSLEPK